MSLLPDERHDLVERLAEWADEARLRGREERADNLLGLAWMAYDLPRSDDLGTCPPGRDMNAPGSAAEAPSLVG